MRTRTKRRVIPLALALALAMIGAALAVPQIGISVQSIGAGEKPIINPIQSASITWSLDSTDPDNLTAINVDLTVDPNVATFSGTVYVKFYDSNGKLVYIASKSISNSDVSNGHITFQITSLKDSNGNIITLPQKVENLNSFTTVAVLYEGS